MEAKTYTYRIPSNYDLGTPASTPSIHFIPELYNSHFLENFTRRCSTRQPLAMDIETTGLKIGSADFRIRMIQVGTADEAFCIPDIDDNIELVYDALTRGSCPVVTQGGVFDWTSLMVKYGVADIQPSRLIDTKMMAHHWDPRTKDYGAPGHSLDALIRLHIHEQVADDVKSAPTKRAAELKITKEEYFKSVALDDPEYVLYAGMDVVCTDLIREQLHKKLAASYARGIHSAELMGTDQEDFYNCILMGAKGMKVDRAYFTKLGQDYTETYESCKNKVREEFGITALGSTKQLAAYFEDNGLPPAKTTPKGAAKVDAVELRRQKDHGSVLADLVLRGKRAQKWGSTFVDGILEASSAADRIHPKFDPLGARTGRYSSSEPNMQNLPGHVSDIRCGFSVDIPDVESGVSIDYNSQELRLLAATSQDPQLCEDLETGKKPPKLLAARIYGENYTESEYVRTKNTLYGTMYGAGPKKLAEQAGISMEESRAVMTELFTMYPETKTYSEHLAQLARQQGYIKNLAGRLIIVDSNRSYSALNYMLQSTGRELIAGAVRDIMRSRWKDAVRLVVHDEIVLVCLTQYVDDMIREVSEMMDAEVNGMRFPVGAEVWGNNWKGHYE